MSSKRPSAFIQALLLSLLLLICGTIQSAEASSDTIECGQAPIRVGLVEFGFLYFVENGQEKGIDKDIVDELSKRSGCTFVTQVMPRARNFAQMENGQIDMLVTALPTPEREKYAWFVTFAKTKVYALIPAKLATSVHSADDFMRQNQLQFGIIRSAKNYVEQEEWLDRMRQQNRVQESVDVLSLFEKLKRGRLDGIFAAPILYLKLFPELQISGEIVVQDWFPNSKGNIGGLMLSKSRFTLADTAKWQSLIQDMQTDGTLIRIFRTYIAESDAKKHLAN